MENPRETFFYYSTVYSSTKFKYKPQLIIDTTNIQVYTKFSIIKEVTYSIACTMTCSAENIVILLRYFGWWPYLF
jgi:hypothetical protein